MNPYHPANTDWLAACDFGLSVHWTAQSAPRTGRKLAFQDAVARFDLDRFLRAVDAQRRPVCHLYPHVTTELNGFQFPWERLTVAAKAGFPERLVTYNAGSGGFYRQVPTPPRTGLFQCGRVPGRC